MNIENIDTNVSHYTLSELMAIIGVNDLDEDQIKTQTNLLHRKFFHKNPQLAVFFHEIQSQLIQYAESLDENAPDENEDEEDNTERKIHVEGYTNMSNEAVYPAGDKQLTNWYENQSLKQNDKNQSDKITDRKQKIDVFGNQHVPMNREQIATTDTYQVPVKQDSLNPNLKNTITRFVNLDSQFRQYTNGIDSVSTDYTLDLSDTLKDTLSLRLYSYQIPYNWYVIDSAYGNTCLWIAETIDNIIYNIPISLPPGNYNQSQFVTTINTSFSDAGFTSATPIVSYNPNNGIITISLYNAIYTGSIAPPFTVSLETQIIFYDFTGVLMCDNNCRSKSNHYFNNTLGWLMGFRVPYLSILEEGNIAPAILDLNGPKYLILVIDDYNQNHVNNGIVSITQFSSTLKMPSYYSPDVPYVCVTPAQAGNNLTQIVAEANLTAQFNGNTQTTLNGLLIGGKYEGDYTDTQIVQPSAPRTLTQSQIYTINEINRNGNNMTNYLAKAPTSSDIMAIIPIKPSTTTGSLIVEFSGSLQDNIRNYFGPVNIDRMAVRLLDDKGNILNLNGTDWCVTLICECLYQY